MAWSCAVHGVYRRLSLLNTPDAVWSIASALHASGKHDVVLGEHRPVVGILDGSHYPCDGPHVVLPGMALILKPPAPLRLPSGVPSVFLAGSIDLGAAVDWQREVERALAAQDVVLLNPRRDDWDASWRQELNEPRFREQVEWELEGLERADVIAMYLAPGSQAPVSLLELGLVARSGRLVICCPEGFWRQGNVRAVALRFGIQLVSSLPELVATVRGRLGT